MKRYRNPYGSCKPPYSTDLSRIDYARTFLYKIVKKRPG